MGADTKGTTSLGISGVATYTVSHHAAGLRIPGTRRIGACWNVLDATTPRSVVRVHVAEGEWRVVHRVGGGWYVPGDLVVTSGDIAEGGLTAGEVLRARDAV